MRGATSRAWVGLLGAVLIGAGCASSPMSRIEDGYRHQRHGYTIARPDGPGEAWQRVTLEGAALAFRRPGREFLGLQRGDIVPSERKISEPIGVYINKRKKFFAQPGLSGKKRAVQITQPCDIEAQEA